MTSPSSTPRSIWYVYGIVLSNIPADAAPSGLDDAEVALECRGDVGALVSVLDGDTYAPSVLEQNSGDVEWLSPRAVAHDHVLTWASDQGAVIPLPMFSLFSSATAVQDMLRARAPQLSDALARV